MLDKVGLPVLRSSSVYLHGPGPEESAAHLPQNKMISLMSQTKNLYVFL